MHDSADGDREETALDLLHLLDQVSHVQEVALRAIELHGS